MCVLGIPALLGFGGGAAAGATAAGATAGAVAGAGTLAGTLQTIGTIVSIGGAALQGIQGYQTARANVAAIEAQKQTQARLDATRDQRIRAQFDTQIAQQRAELSARGISMDSVTAVMLGQTAAQELSFESQSVRSGAAATQAELTSQQRAARAEGVSSLLRGGASAAGSFLTAAPTIWPGLLDRRTDRLLG